MKENGGILNWMFLMRINAKKRLILSPIKSPQKRKIE